MKGLVFTYLLTYGGAVAALFRPFVGVLIYVAFAILMPEYLWPWSLGQGGSYSRVIALALLVGWTAQGFGSWRLGRGRAVVCLLLGFLGWTALSASQAPNQEVAWGFVAKLSKIVLPFLVGITTLNTARDLKALVWTIFLCEGYLALEFNLGYLSGYNRLRLEGFGPIDNNCNAIALVTCLGLSFGACLGEPDRRLAALASVASILMVHAILFSFSRGGMLALGVTGLMSFVLMLRRPRHYLGAVLGTLLVLNLAGTEIRERFFQIVADSSGERDESAQSRLELWADLYQVMKLHPTLGAGPEHWPLLASSFGWREGKEGHSLWLQMGAEVGFPGMLLLALFYAVCICRLWPIGRGRVAVPDPLLRDTACMVIASLIGFAVAAQFVSVRVLEQPYYVALVGTGVLKLSSIPNRWTSIVPT